MLFKNFSNIDINSISYTKFKALFKDTFYFKNSSVDYNETFSNNKSMPCVSPSLLKPYEYFLQAYPP